MKKLIKALPLMLIILLASFLLIISKGNDATAPKEKDLRQIVWEQLSEIEQNEIIGGWKNGTIEKIIAKKDSMKFFLEDETLDGKEVYLITFRSKDEAMIGNVQRLVHMESKKIVGFAYRM